MRTGTNIEKITNQLLLQCVSDAIVITDAQFIITTWNTAAEHLFGYKEQEVLGRDMALLIPPALTAYPSIKNNGFAEGMVEHLNRQQQIIQVHAAVHPIQQAVAITGFLIIYRPVTSMAGNQLPVNNKKEQTSTQAVNSQALWNVLENIRNAFVILNTNLQFTYMNRQAGKIFRRNRSYLIGKHIWTEFPEISNTPFQTAFEKAIHTGQYTCLEEYFYAFSRQWLAADIYPSPEGVFVFIRDITRKKEAVIALQESEEKYRMLIEQAMDGIFICDSDGHFLYVNSKACEMSGYSRKELLKVNFMDLVPPDRRITGPDKFFYLRSGPLLYKDGQLLRKDGSIMLVEISSQFTADGNVVSISHDITARKKAELALQQSEERYRRLIELASDGIIIFTRDFRCIDANSSMCKLTGYSKDELMNMCLLDLADTDDLLQNPPKISSLTPGSYYTNERKMKRKDGSSFYAESVTQIMPDDQVVSFFRDITERKQAELALQQSEAKHRLLFQQSPLPLFVMDLETFYFRDVNEAAIGVYGYSKEEFLHLTALDIRPAEDYEKFYKRVSQARAGLISVGLFRHVKKDGSMIDVEIYSHDFSFDEKPSRLVLAIDVTEKLKAEREFRKTAEQLRELSDHLQNIREEERASMAREIHDELGQQLTILKMDISWLHKKLKQYNDAEALQRTEETLKMLNDTIKTVRKIATELRPSMLDDLGLIAALEWQSKEFENRSGIKIFFETNAMQLPVSAAVATSLFRIYQESLTNIGRHANAKNIFSSLWLQHNQIILTIRDDGQGFDMRILGSKKTLGLLGMKERTLMMGGRFEINSAPGKGTIIEVTTSIQ